MSCPLFLVGNKRSGTSQLVRTLNLHPQVFISHESDILWILYQYHNDQSFRSHSWDSDRGMRYTLGASGHLLRPEASPFENFLTVQMSMLEKGSPWLRPQNKTHPQWVGDKKPMQHTDPKLLKFLLQNFPEAHFLHIVRHPFDVVASSGRFNRTADGDFWIGLSEEEKVERWAFHEQQVLHLRRVMPEHIHTLRYEDFCRHTKEELTGIFRFLDLTPDPHIFQEAERRTYVFDRPVRSIRCSAETRRIAAIYGYDLRYQASRPAVMMQNIFWLAVKKLRAQRNRAQRRL